MDRLLRIIFAIFIFIPNLIWSQNDSLQITGHLKKHADYQSVKKVSFSYIDKHGEREYITSDVKNGMFTLTLPRQNNVTDGMLNIAGNKHSNAIGNRPLSVFFNEKDLLVEADHWELELAQVSGDEENELYNSLRQSTAGITREIREVYSFISENRLDSESLEYKAHLNKLSELTLKLYSSQKEFIKENPKSYVSLFLLYRMKNLYTADDFADVYEGFSKQTKDTYIGLEISEIVEGESITRKGKPALNFIRTTAEGKRFELTDLNGKVFLIDFWGSWCGPCIASMPHLKELYKKYKDDGFEILGVAQERGKTLDDSEESWKKAIDKLGIHWINVLNNENSQEFDIVKEYRITGFPTKILVDENGKILLRITASATNDIDVALEEIYGY